MEVCANYDDWIDSAAIETDEEDWGLDDIAAFKVGEERKEERERERVS